MSYFQPDIFLLRKWCLLALWEEKKLVNNALFCILNFYLNLGFIKINSTAGPLDPHSNDKHLSFCQRLQIKIFYILCPWLKRNNSWANPIGRSSQVVCYVKTVLSSNHRSTGMLNLRMILTHPIFFSFQLLIGQHLNAFAQMVIVFWNSLK